jgi:hypothetical protein
MRLGRRPSAPTNEEHVTVPVYGLDPHGAALFAGVVNGTLGALGRRPVIDASGPRWHGWTAAPQLMRGAGNIGGGRPRVPAGSTLDQERSSADSIQSAFEQRMIARRWS